VEADGLSGLLRSAGMEVTRLTGQDACHLETVSALVARHRGTVVVIDPDGGEEGDGATWIRPLVLLGAQVVVLGGHDDLARARMVADGAAGILDRVLPPSELVGVIRRSAQGDRLIPPGERRRLRALLARHLSHEERLLERFARLTYQEQAILAAMMAGGNPQAVAGARQVSVTTVRAHIRSVLRKLGVRSQLQAVSLARQTRWELPRHQR
jgi:DNA-binding NarL/FixJ family response regulator